MDKLYTVEVYVAETMTGAPVYSINIKTTERNIIKSASVYGARRAMALSAALIKAGRELGQKCENALIEQYRRDNPVTTKHE